MSVCDRNSEVRKVLVVGVYVWCMRTCPQTASLQACLTSIYLLLNQRSAATGPGEGCAWCSGGTSQLHVT